MGACVVVGGIHGKVLGKGGERRLERYPTMTENNKQEKPVRNQPLPEERKRTRFKVYCR